MENPKSYTQLVVIAVQVMQANELEEVFVTEDGQAFYEEDRAKLHASNIGSKVYSFEKKKMKFAQQAKKGKENKTEPAEVEKATQEGTTDKEPTEGDEQKTE